MAGYQWPEVWDVLANETEPTAGALGSSDEVPIIQMMAYQHNETNADCDRQFIAQKIEQPESANQRQRERADDNRDFRKAPEINVEQQHDDGERNRTHYCQALLRAHHVLILTCPCQRIARW